jgi:hypothetical protein
VENTPLPPREKGISVDVIPGKKIQKGGKYEQGENVEKMWGKKEEKQGKGDSKLGKQSGKNKAKRVQEE